MIKVLALWVTVLSFSTFSFCDAAGRSILLIGARFLLLYFGLHA
jgi:hypothetical protein